MSPPLQLAFQGDLNVYTSATAWPRAFFTDRLAWYNAPADLGRLIRAGDGRPFAAMQVSERVHVPDLSDDLAGRAIDPATDYELTANSTSFTVHADGPGLVVLQENWFPADFRVTLNGRPVAYVRVNHAFKGVFIPGAGEYRVSFAYWPHHLSLALGMALVGAIIFGGVFWWGWRNNAG